MMVDVITISDDEEEVQILDHFVNIGKHPVVDLTSTRPKKRKKSPDISQSSGCGSPQPQPSPAASSPSPSPSPPPPPPPQPQNKAPSTPPPTSTSQSKPLPSHINQKSQPQQQHNSETRQQPQPEFVHQTHAEPKSMAYDQYQPPLRPDPQHLFNNRSQQQFDSRTSNHQHNTSDPCPSQQSRPPFQPRPWHQQHQNHNQQQKSHFKQAQQSSPRPQPQPPSPQPPSPQPSTHKLQPQSHQAEVQYTHDQHRQQPPPQPSLRTQPQVDQSTVKQRPAQKRPQASDHDLMISKKETGNRHFRNNSFNEAIRYYREAAELAKKLNELDMSAIIHFNLAMSYDKLGAHNQAADECAAAVKLNDKYIKAHVKRAEIFMSQGKYEEAVICYEHVCELDITKKDDAMRRICLAKEWAKTAKKRDQHEILGLKPYFSLDDLRAAYKQKARAHHPDKHSDADIVTRRIQEKIFKEASEAYSFFRKRFG